jgi:YgiT-type zinc finger domain-containing protein
MHCSIKDCTGEYEDKKIIHAVRYKGEVVVIDNVPAQVCSLCGDVLFTPETQRHIENILQERSTPTQTVPMYEFA